MAIPNRSETLKRTLPIDVSLFVAGLFIGMFIGMQSCQAETWFQFESGIGATYGEKSDGRWYNGGLPNSTGTTAPSIRLGLQFNALEPDGWVPGVKLHLTYNWLGNYNWTALAAEDQDAGHTYGYNPSTRHCNNNNCGSERVFHTTGWTQDIALTVEPYWNIGNGWHVGMEVGPVVYISKMDSSATNLTESRFGAAGAVENFHHRQSPALGAMAGVSLGKGPLSLRYDYTYTPYHSSGNYVPPAMNGYHRLTLNYVW